MKQEKIVWILGLLLLFGVMAQSIQAYPPLPTEFYGKATWYGQNASVGLLVSAHVNAAACGTFTISDASYYGTLTCRGNDTEQAGTQGGTTNAEVTFRLGGLNAHAIGDANWSSGDFSMVNISVPIPFCGDSFCDPTFEGCNVCVLDCGVCIPTGGGGDGTGGGGGGGGGTGDGGIGGDGGVIAGILPLCAESWTCGEWTSCGVEGLQSRLCSDRNSCGTATNKPEEVQECVYEFTCFDGVQNGDETGIDCGGSCGPCMTCYDGIQNQGEENIDCGGPCLACGTCFDELWNNDEEGIDCGGPCEKECPPARPPILQLPTKVCEKKINLIDPYFLLGVLIIFLIIIGRIIYTERNIARIKKDKKLNDLERAKRYLSARRRMYLFIITLVTLAVLILVYSYLFFLCPTDFLTYLWVLLLFLLLSPLLVHRIMKFYEYNEKETLKRLGRIFDAHYQQIKQLIDIQDEHLMEMEQRLSTKLYELTTNKDRQELLEQYPDLKRIYRDVVKLYEKYHEHKTPYGIEKDLCEHIYALAEDKTFIALAEKLPEIKIIYEILRLLYEQYEEKQKLYDELDHIEHPERYQKKEKGKEEVPETLDAVKHETVDKEQEGQQVDQSEQPEQPKQSEQDGEASTEKPSSEEQTVAEPADKT